MKFLGLITITVIITGAIAYFLYENSNPLAPEETLAQVQDGLAQELTSFLVPSNPPNYLPIRNYDVPDPTVDAKSAVIVDKATGRVLYEKNGHQRLPVASVTKLMTAIVVLDKYDINDSFEVSAKSAEVGGSGVDLVAGEKIFGLDLLKVMLIPSSNNAAFVFAEAGTEYGIDFVEEMNEQALKLGMYDTLFTNPAGLDDGAYSTAHDIIKLASQVSEYPIIWEILRTQATTVFSIGGEQAHQLVNTNQLLTSIKDVVGGKTGNTDGALGTMVLEVLADAQNDNSVIVVLLGSQDRFRETKKLADFATNAHSWRK